jgi:hypothetical protein
VSTSPRNGQKQSLEKLARIALTVIIGKNPKRPRELKGLSRTQIEHDRDVENLKWVLMALLCRSCS